MRSDVLFGVLSDRIEMYRGRIAVMMIGLSLKPLQCKGLLDLVPEIRYLEMSDHLSEDGICCIALGRCNARTLLA